MERFLLKIFGNSPTIQTGVFGSETSGNIQYSEDPTTIQSLSAWSEGLGGATSNATKQPAINDIQGIFKVLTIAIKNNQISGIPLYLATETYQIGSIVLNIEEDQPILYYSLTANNTGNALTDDTNWANLYSYISSLISSNFVLLDGSNATFNNLSANAKENILSSVLGSLQTEDETKIGYIKFFDTTSTTTSIILPEGGTFMCSFSSYGGAGNTLLNGSLCKYGLYAGGTTFNSTQGSLAICGWYLKIQ